MAKRPSISIVGAGNLASGLAASLRRAGYTIDEIVSRTSAKSVRNAGLLARKVGAGAATLAKARLAADVLILAVPDGSITECAEAIAKKGLVSRIVLHCSGALTSDELCALREKGASIGSMHPLMSFVAGKAPSLKGVLFSIEGDRRAVAAAKGIARGLGGSVFLIDKKKKVLYHAFGAFTSPLLVAHLTAAETLSQKAGIPKRLISSAMLPIVQQTLENYFSYGGGRAFSGPLVRGDLETIRRHLRALGEFPELKAAYIAQCRMALASLPVAQKGEIARLLK